MLRWNRENWDLLIEWLKDSISTYLQFSGIESSSSTLLIGFKKALISLQKSFRLSEGSRLWYELLSNFLRFELNVDNKFSSVKL